MTWTESPLKMGWRTLALGHVSNLFHALTRPVSWTSSLDMGECLSLFLVVASIFGFNLTFWWSHIISVPYPKLLVISGTDWRKPDPVAADSWLHVVRGGCPWINACPRLCAWTVSLWPRPVCHDYVEKYYARLGWKSNWLFLDIIFFMFATVFLDWLFLFWIKVIVDVFPEQRHNFRKQLTNNLNSPYDYGSLMHYGRWAENWGEINTDFMFVYRNVTYMSSSCTSHSGMPFLKMVGQQLSPSQILTFPLASEMDPVF